MVVPALLGSLPNDLEVGSNPVLSALSATSQANKERKTHRWRQGAVGRREAEFR